MQFYKVEAKYGEMPDPERDSVLQSREFAHRMEERAESARVAMPDNVYYFFSNFSDDRLVAGIISEQTGVNQKQLWDFLDVAEMKFSEVKTEEITFRQLRSMLRTADRCFLIEDDCEVLERFGLDLLTGRESRGLDISDNLLVSATREELYAEAARYAVADTFLPELKRIYAGAQKPAVSGHPVHYLLCTDDTDLRRDLCRTLLKALYANGRLPGKRYNFANVHPERGVSAAAMDALYRCCTGAALLLRFDDVPENEESDCADETEETIEVICHAAKKYRNRVLTVFCLPREATKFKKQLQEQLGNMALVEFQEEYMADEEAKRFLRQLTKGSGLRADKRLYDGLEPGKGYLTPELREQFRQWYDRKLKDTVYPQYKDFQPAAKLIAKQAPKGAAYDELQAMIGLTEAKAVIRKALDYYKVQRFCSEKGLRQDRPAMHMVFTGNPGTAKTTAARLFARIMKDNGVLSKGHLVEVGRGDLVGRYVGWTAKIVQEKFRTALGGVLFIDEAYSLVDDRNGSYGDEAINTIVQEMENHREELVVIFAGYPDKMEEFLRKNPGLRSRVAFHVPFADYDTQALCQIAAHMAGKRGMRLTDGAMEKLATVFDTVRKQPDFGNGRYVRNLLEQSGMNLASRLLKSDFDEFSAETLTTLRAEDIELPAGQKNTSTCKIGFAV